MSIDVSVMKPTFWHGLRIRHVHSQLQRPMASDAGLGNQARRDSDDAALRQLAAPPVGSQKLHELALGVGALIFCSGIGQKVLVEYS